MSETPESAAMFAVTLIELRQEREDGFYRDEEIVAALAAMVAARDREQRINGACDLALALGWSTGHGESMEALIEESRDNLRRERAALAAIRKDKTP